MADEASGGELSEFEVCPECGAKLEAEAEKCGACSASLFDSTVETLRPPQDPAALLKGEAPQGFVAVNQGSLAEVTSLQVALRRKGIETLVRDEELKAINPFLAGGGGALDYELLAAREEAEDVRAAILLLREESGELDPAIWSEAGDADEALHALARRVRWAALLVLLAPIGAWLGSEYLVRSARTDRRSRRHGLTLAAMALAMVETGLLGYLIAEILATVAGLLGVLGAIAATGFFLLAVLVRTFAGILGGTSET